LERLVCPFSFNDKRNRKASQKRCSRQRWEGPDVDRREKEEKKKAILQTYLNGTGYRSKEGGGDQEKLITLDGRGGKSLKYTGAREFGVESIGRQILCSLQKLKFSRKKFHFRGKEKGAYPSSITLEDRKRWDKPRNSRERLRNRKERR